MSIAASDRVTRLGPAALEEVLREILFVEVTFQQESGWNENEPLGSRERKGKGPEAGVLLVCVQGVLWMEWSQQKKKRLIGNEIREVARDQVTSAVVRLLGLFYLFSIEV